MSSSVTLSTFLHLTSTYDPSATIFGALAIGLLAILVIEKEFIRAVDHPKAKLWFQVLDIAIPPLFFVFSVIVVIRTLNLIHL